MKVTCGTCANELKGKCTVKGGKSSVALHKRRNCDKYSLDESKVKEPVDIPTTRVSYADVLEYKKKLKELKKAAKTKENDVDRPIVNELAYHDDAHPITGDLSRFTSTAAKLKGN